VIGRVSQAPLNRQSNHTQRLDGLQLWAKDLREHMAATPHAQARTVYTEALQHDPDNYRLHDNYAEFLDLVGDLKEAAVERGKSRDLIPYYYFSHYSLGLVLKELGRLDEARDALLQAVALNPQLGDVHLELGTVYARRMEWALAAQEYERAHQLRPEDPRVLLYSGEVLWKLNRRAEALEQLRQALRLDPGYWEAHYRLGEDLAVEGQIAEATAEFKETLRINPRYVKAHVNLAVALLKLGRSQEAAQQFEETLRLDPNNKQALEFQRQALGQPRR
ncbi:MAG TPA: tetratricopeptide repeat protein, partial [Candidatus Sulfotelmatobacter sp.]|nr:tetratricopeptide repeat protein [Candidatus Sulfotelmatobacter sp.]